MPDRETVVGVFEASLAKLIWPVGLPAMMGANITVNGALWPAVRVSGNVRPCSVKTLLVTVTEDTFTVPPVAVIVPDRVPVSPRRTLPKTREAGFAFN